MSAVLWEWWDFALRDDLRARLMSLPNREVPPDLAAELWRLGPPIVLQAQPSVVSPDGYQWVLEPLVADFIAERDYERRRPQDFR